MLDGCDASGLGQKGIEIAAPGCGIGGTTQTFGGCVPHDEFDPSSQTHSSFGLRVPERQQHVQHVIAGDVSDRDVAEDRLRVHLQSRSPLIGVLTRAPRVFVYLDVLLRHVDECARQCPREGLGMALRFPVGEV